MTKYFSKHLILTFSFLSIVLFSACTFLPFMGQGVLPSDRYLSVHKTFDPELPPPPSFQVFIRFLELDYGIESSTLFPELYLVSFIEKGGEESITGETETYLSMEEVLISGDKRVLNIYHSEENFNLLLHICLASAQLSSQNSVTIQTTWECETFQPEELEFLAKKKKMYFFKLKKKIENEDENYKGSAIGLDLLIIGGD